ncbi:MAG: YheC/YheD family protein [Clostridiaceae bacterium]|nr:YheC/YheD family protein [Clostridiaceae bacterium]
MLYKIISNKESSGKVFVNDKFAKEHLFINKLSVFIRAGSKAVNIEIVKNSMQKDDEIILSQDVIETLLLPTSIKYQIRQEKDSLIIGPVIGLLMGANKEKFTKRVLKELTSYSHIYPEVNGLLLVIYTEGIDFINKTVKGYYYNPASDSKNSVWKEGVFPFPNSIFQRINLTEDVRIRLNEETNKCVFNSDYFSKWEFFKMVSNFRPFFNHLPDTRLLESTKDLEQMVSLYKEVYLKTLNGTLSRGIYKITSINGEYELKDKDGASVAVTTSFEKMEAEINAITKNKNYLMQQALHPLMVNERHTDFRVIMQKNHTLDWICTGIFTFIGRRAGISSSWGYISTFERFLEKNFNFNEQDIFKKRQEVIRVCKDVCKILDASGENYGDLGFDVLIDEELKVWVLEANKRHYHTVPLWMDDTETFYETKANPIKYATALSGFEVYE